MTKQHPLLHLYWFSASGNTHQAAVAFAERLQQLGWAVELRSLEHSDPQAIDPDAMLGLAFPTHSFTVPEIVRSFVRLLPQSEGAAAIMLGTHGAFSGGVVGPLKRELTAKGFRCTAAKIITMPDSFFPFSSDVANQTKLKKGIAQTIRYAEDVASSKASWRRWAVLADLYAAFWKGLFGSRKWCRKYFTTVHVQSARCMRCGTCVRLCPVGALEQDHAALPCITKKCTNCLRCVAICPNDAMRHMIGFRPYRSEEARILKKRFEQ